LSSKVMVESYIVFIQELKIVRFMHGIRILIFYEKK
jgi:hypothetical protein